MIKRLGPPSIDFPEENKAESTPTHRVLQFQNGDRYEGQTLGEKPHGHGMYVFPDGGCYVGSWEDGLENGKGTYIEPSGIRYTGGWYNGAEHGQGTRYYPDGSRIEGNWADGQTKGPVVYVDPSGFKVNCESNDLQCSKADPKDISHPLFIANLVGDKKISGSLNGWQALVLIHGIDKLIANKSLDPTTRTWLMKCSDRINQAVERSIDTSSAQDLLSEIKHIQPGESLVMNYHSDEHAMVIQITPHEKNYLFDIFNSGNGLSDWHHQTQFGSKTKYQTRKRFLLKEDSVNLELMRDLLKSELNSVNSAYETLAERAIPNRDAENDSANLRTVWQSEQKSWNCQLESWMAWMKNTAPNLRSYTRFRKALCELALSECQQHPEMQRLQHTDPATAKRLIDELRRKIHKRTNAQPA